MDYDKLIERLRNNNIENNCHDCALGYYAFEAATAIETLCSDLARVTAERDAALTDLRKWSICATCKRYNPHGKKSHCKAKEEYLPGGNWAGCSKWEWKGIKED